MPSGPSGRSGARGRRNDAEGADGGDATDARTDRLDGHNAPADAPADADVPGDDALLLPEDIDAVDHIEAIDDDRIETTDADDTGDTGTDSDEFADLDDLDVVFDEPDARSRPSSRHSRPHIDREADTDVDIPFDSSAQPSTDDVSFTAEELEAMFELSSTSEPSTRKRGDSSQTFPPVTASECFQKALELLEEDRHADALEFIDNALNLNYFGADICTVKGEILLDLKRFDEALTWFNKAQELDPLSLDVLLWKGTAFFHQRRYQRALSCFNRVLDKDPTNADALLKKGMALFEQGQFERAGDVLTEAREANSAPERQAEIDFWVGKIARRSGQEEEARRLLERLVKNHPSHIAAYAELGDLLRSQGRYKRARRVYEKGIEREPNDPALQNDFGNLLRELGDLETSLRHLTRAIAINGDHEVAYYNRALTFEELGRHEEAARDYLEALRLDESDVDAHRKACECLSRLGRFDDVIQRLEALLRDSPDDVDTIHTLADVLARYATSLEQQGKWADAKTTMRRLIDLDPDSLWLNLDPGFEFGIPRAGSEQAPTAPAAVAPGGPTDPAVLLAQGDSGPDVPDAAAPDPDAERQDAWLKSTRAAHLRDAARAYRELAQRETDGDAALIAATYARVVGETAPATTDLDLALRLLPKDAFVRFIAADLARINGEREAAFAHLDASLKLRPAFLEAYWLKAALLEERAMRDDEEDVLFMAIETYREGIRRGGLDARWAGEPLARLYEETGQYERALRALRYVAGLDPIAPIEELAGSALDDIARTRELRELRAEYRKRMTSAMPPTDTPTDTQPVGLDDAAGELADDEAAERANLCFLAGRILISMGRPDDAIPLLHTAAKRDPREVEYLLFLGFAYHDNGQPRQASIYLEKVIELASSRDPDLAGAALTALATVALKRRDFDRATTLLNEAAGYVRGDTREIALGRAMVAFEAGRYCDAREHTDRVLVKSPAHDGLFTQALYLRARIAFHERAYDVALEALDEVILDEPYSLKAWSLRVWLQRARHDLDQTEAAEAEYKFLQAFVPALELINRERFVDARDTLSRLQAQFPARADVSFHLASAHAALGDRGPALSALARSIEIDASFRDEAGLAPYLDSLRHDPDFLRLVGRDAQPGQDGLPSQSSSSSSAS